MEKMFIKWNYGGTVLEKIQFKKNLLFKQPSSLLIGTYYWLVTDMQS